MKEGAKPAGIGYEEQILHEKTFELDALAQELGIGVNVVQGAVDKLQKKGYGFVQVGETVLRTNAIREGTVFDYSKQFDKTHLHFGVVSDTHLSSKQERLDALERLYDTFEQEGVTQVFHAGDLTDGYGVYRGQEFELKQLGQAEQIAYAIANYPHRKGITTSFISGNHDLRQYERGGVDPGVPIADKRKDMRYLGPMTAKVKFPSGIEMELLHPDGGVAYALSYKAQRAINNLTPDNMPDILVYGHYHTSFYMCYRGIHFLQVPCTKGQGLWEKRLGINPTIGGWLVDATIMGRHIERFKPELIQK